MLTDSTIVSELAQYGFRSSHSQCELVRIYISSLLKWNQKISLTTVVDPIEILRFHFGESLYAIQTVPIQKGRLADVGSGAGFPGLALALGVPELSTTLIESNSKKAAFLSEIIRELRLDGAKVLRDRMESVDSGPNPFDFVTARAVGSHDALLAWAARNLGRGGKVVLWLGEDEVTRVTTSSSIQWKEPALIPGSKKRFILSGSLA